MTDHATDPASPAAIAFIGGGNMARSLIGGLIASGTDPGTIRVAAPSESTRRGLQQDFGVATFQTAAEAVQGAGVWMFAVKPQVMRGVCEDLQAAARALRVSQAIMVQALPSSWALRRYFHLFSGMGLSKITLPQWRLASSRA